MITMTRFKTIGFWGALCTLLLASSFVTGCKSGSDPRFAEIPGLTGPAPAAQTASPAATPVEATQGTNTPARGRYDMILPGDNLTIIIEDLPTQVFPRDERVREDGSITLLQNQTFEAAGKTRGQLEKEIRERYVPRIFKTMTVSVQFKKDTQFYYVGGEVKIPNRQVYLSRVTVLKAIQSAGDFTEFANKHKVELTRVDGHKFVINCVKAQKDPKLDLEVFPGDKVWVPRRWL
jgi:protein involved in polysaccharide export with SLBB domain